MILIFALLRKGKTMEKYYSGYGVPRCTYKAVYAGFTPCENGKYKKCINSVEYKGNWISGYLIPGYYEGTYYIGDPQKCRIKGLVFHAARGSGKSALSYHVILTTLGFKPVIPETIGVIGSKTL